ncbi:MAG TPA: hypothetical protein VKR58_00415, partial [Aquella sp.]|nr:hypothetical protein [Aquella sp.]
ILTASLEGKWDESHVIKNQSEGSILTDKIKNNFDTQVINYTAQILTEADKSPPADVIIMIDCLHRLLRIRDDKFVTSMKELNTVL